MDEKLDFESLRTGAGIFEVLSKAKALERAGKTIIHFEIGQPDFPTPSHVKEAAKQALDDNFTGYVAAAGVLELRQAIQNEIEFTRGFRPTVEQILVTPGANPGIYFTLRAIVSHHTDEVIYSDPSFPTYGAVLNYLGCKKKPIPLKEENNFRLDPDDIESAITKNTKVVIINSPMNPTGSVMKQDEINQVAELAEEYNFYLLTDEIYSKMTYDQKFYSPSIRDQTKERTIILDGFSKAYNMTGWRLGYAIAPERIMDRMGLLISTTVSCTTSFIQKAGISALTGPQTDLHTNMQAFRKRRDAIVKGLNNIPGFSCLTPQGAFYAFPNIMKTGMSSKELADFLLNNAGVACLPGTIFGANGEGYLRFSYATDVTTIQQAISQIKEALA
ncbi:aspartate aminotransferase [Candidatus Heimdallarchaeota archaeon B3_Heim]|nr:MAG: aspartate aminotransferase [Candidatus Heimdallarchaeota archaeon B3_Heim]